MEKMNFKVEDIKKCLSVNAKNQTTATYELLLKKKYRSGNPSKFDICSESFD